ncbi:hypothetical protein FVP60_05840 [Microbacterium mitrae]|uniref:Uncharacterized protein n=2 Tax=Microbacterium mitrae TaxID=664640 RepID=A0A5C8HT75_9MICO|nr:hypothetical protein FVP60_05840 [Microbacterium mitrae]
MPSGSIASINLTDPPAAVEYARDMLREAGAFRIDYDTPVQAFAGNEHDEVRARRAGQQNAPDAVAPARGEDQNTNTYEGEPIMSNATRSPEPTSTVDVSALWSGQPIDQLTVGELAEAAREAGMLPTEFLALAVPETELDVVDYTGDVTQEEADWANQNLMHREIRFVQSETPVELVTDSAGRLWRRAFTITSYTTDEGEDCFLVRVLSGAKDVDLEDAEKVLRDARRGHFLRAGWRVIDNDEAGNARHTYRTYRLYRPSIEHEFNAVLCDVQKCHRDWHATDGKHVLDEILQDHYTIRIQQSIDGSDATLSLDVFDELDGVQTDRLLNDLLWARGECDKINGAR